MNAPRVSIIVPAFNVETFLEKAVSSALSQTEQSLEIVVVDDCSDDCTREVLAELAANDDRVKAIYLDANAGVSHARNVALAAAAGEWIAVLDSDDWYDQNRIADMLRYGEENGADIVADNLTFEIEDERRSRSFLFDRTGPSVRSISAIEFIENNAPFDQGWGLAKPIIRRAFLTTNHITYDERFTIGEDTLLLLECLAKGARFSLTNAPTYHYRIRRDSITSMPKTRLLREIMRVNDAALGYFAGAGDIEAERALSHQKSLIKKEIRLELIFGPLRSKNLIKATFALLKDLAIGPYLLFRVYIFARRYLS